MAPVSSPASFGQTSMGSPASFRQRSVALAQIDENSSVERTSGNASVLLPHLLGHTAFQADALDDSTPADPLPKKHSCAGDCTPEAWPKTPTLIGRFGDQTPESWPEFVPSFHVDEQQQDLQLQQNQQQPSLQAMPTMMFSAASSGISMLQPVLPMWSGHMRYAFDMVFDNSMANVPSMGVPSQPMLAQNSRNLPHAGSEINRCSAFTDMAPRPNSTVAAAKAFKASGVGCRDAAVVVSPNIDSAGVGDACPVAVYVDLSALRERNVGPSRVQRTPH